SGEYPMAQLKFWHVGFFAIIGMVVTASPALAYHHPRHVGLHREIAQRGVIHHVVERPFVEARHGLRTLQMAYEPDAFQQGSWRSREFGYDRSVTSALAAGSQSGIASWYGAGGMTAASLTLRMGSLARVTRDDGRSVVVRIADRGPFIRGRIIDLSRS